MGGTVVSWSQPISRMGSLNERPIDWARPRRTGIVVRDGDGDIVSDYGDWNGGDHDPDDWFPLDIRFTAVVVARDGTFSGWQNHVP